jgi:hypothetical protein
MYPVVGVQEFDEKLCMMHWESAEAEANVSEFRKAAAGKPGKPKYLAVRVCPNAATVLQSEKLEPREIERGHLLRTHHFQGNFVWRCDHEEVQRAQFPQA